jgi:hypothetical protein
VIAGMVALANTCAIDGSNHCTDNKYHNADNGTTEGLFAAGQASNDMGFSEQSFFIRAHAPDTPLFIISMPWGPSQQSLLYSDTFVTSAATCGPVTACATDAQAFTTLMTSVSMKNYIVRSEDLPTGSPWRTLLVANEAFWAQGDIRAHPLYEQFARVLPTAVPYPNTFTAGIQTSMGQGICTALKISLPTYGCKGVPAPPAMSDSPAPMAGSGVAKAAVARHGL